MIMNKMDTKYKKLGTTSSYPGKNNCYRVEVTPPKGESYIADYMKKEEYELIIFLQEIKYIISCKEMKKLETLIENYGNRKYSDAIDDCAMEAAGSDL